MPSTRRSWLEAAPSVPPFAPPAYRQPFRSWTALVDSGLRATQRRSGRFVNTPSAKQVLTPYHFGRSVEAGIEALDPEVLVLLGPGSSLGGAIGQTLCHACAGVG